MVNLTNYYHLPAIFGISVHQNMMELALWLMYAQMDRNYMRNDLHLAMVI